MKAFFHNIAVECYKFFMFRILYPLCYKFFSTKEVVPNKVVFIENYSSTITDNFSLIVDRLKKNPKFNNGLHFCFLMQNSVSRFQYIKNNINMIKLISNAEYILLNNPSDVIACLKLNSNTNTIQTWHACGAFKKFGLSCADSTFGTKKSIQKRYPYHAKYDLVTVSSPNVVWAYNDAMGFNPNDSGVKPIGVSRTDVFFNDKYISLSRNKLNSVIPNVNSRKIILYMPTFRGSTANAKAPTDLDFDLMFNHLKDDYILLVKYHPLIKEVPKVPTQYQDFIFDCTFNFNPNELICCADIFITDYSSAVFEFSLFEKPMFFYAPDLNDYYDERGFYYKYEDFVMGEVCYSTETLIDRILNIDETTIKKTIDFKNKYMQSCDGHATDRIVDWIVSKGGNFTCLK